MHFFNFSTFAPRYVKHMFLRLCVCGHRDIKKYIAYIIRLNCVYDIDFIYVIFLHFLSYLILTFSLFISEKYRKDMSGNNSYSNFCISN